MISQRRSPSTVPRRPASAASCDGGGSSVAGVSASCSCTCQLHSFAPGTRVLLADGSTAPIEDIKLGDDVVATDPQTGETAAREVTNLHLNIDTDLTRLTVADVASGERSVLETTQNHPFWDATVGEWVEASKLTPGHRLLVHDEDRLEGDGTGAGSGGGGPPTEILVDAVDNHTGTQVMRDLTVADTYHILAGDEPVLVHNNHGCPDEDPDLGDGPEAGAVNETTPYRAGTAVSRSSGWGVGLSRYIDHGRRVVSGWATKLR